MQAISLKNKKGFEVKGPLLITPTVFNDERGCFFESWNEKVFNELLETKISFSQDNVSQSSKGVLRGLHYQTDPEPQGKLIRCSMGTIFDVAVDLRKHSKTFGEWVGTEISAINKRQLWIPIGFAHGFLTLSEHAEVSYKATGYWNKNCEHSIRWNDKKLNINWPTMHLKTNPILSEKDKIAPILEDAISKGNIFR